MMVFIEQNWWILIWSALFISIISYIFMVNASRHFRYDRWTARTFSILDLQLPSSPRYYTFILTNLVIKSERKENNDKVPLKALKTNLYWDFPFMIGIYSFTAILALHASSLGMINSRFFIILASFQVIALILDIIENVIILKSTLKPKIFIKTLRQDKNEMFEDEQYGTSIYFFYIWVVRLKWLIVTLGLMLPFLTILFVYFFRDLYSDVAAMKGILTFVVTIIVLILGTKLQSAQTEKF